MFAKAIFDSFTIQALGPPKGRDLDVRLGPPHQLLDKLSWCMLFFLF